MPQRSAAPNCFSHCCRLLRVVSAAAVCFCAAPQAGDDKKLLQVASRKKKLEERHGLERNAAGRRFKVGRLVLPFA